MDNSPKALQALLDKGLECVGEHRFDVAGSLFLEALELIETSPEGPGRWKWLALAATICRRAGYPDLSLMAAQGILESQDRRSNPALHCADLLRLANIWNELRPAASSAVNEAALAHALEHSRYADAASASTNLAINDVNAGRLPQSFERLKTSLKYLANDDSNPDTDAVTRLSLLKVVDAMQADPAVALEASADLFTRLEPHVGPERWKSAAPAFHRLVDRYAAAHPELDVERWKRETFPLVFDGE